MINLDDSNLLNASLNTDGVYHFQDIHKCQLIKDILLDGTVCKHVVFADTNKNFLIRHKTTIDGQVVVSEGEIVFEMLFGNVEVIKWDGEEPRR